MPSYPAALSAGILAGQCFPAMWRSGFNAGSCRSRLIITLDISGLTNPGFTIKMAGRVRSGHDLGAGAPGAGCHNCDPTSAGDPYYDNLPPYALICSGTGWAVGGSLAVAVYDVWKAWDDAIWTSSVAFEIYAGHNGFAVSKNFKAYAGEPSYLNCGAPRQIQSWNANVQNTAGAACAGTVTKTLTINDDGTSSVA